MGHQKKHHEEEPAGESAPLWIISFCDLALCMLSFFVNLSCTAGKNTAFDPECMEVVAAIKRALRHLPPGPPTDTSDLKSILGALKSQKGRSGTSGKPGESIQQIDGMSGKHTMVTTVRQGTQTTIGGSISFPANSTELTDDAISGLKQIADKIRGHMNVFMIKGHTSRDEEHLLKNSKTDLSYDRANVVLQKLVEFGVAREGLRIQSCRDFEPIREGAYSEATRAENRRVEVIATEAFISEYRSERPSTNSANKLADLTRKVEKQIREQRAQETTHPETGKHESAEAGHD